MVEGMLRILPAARIGQIGLYRDPETLGAVEYYFKLPNEMSDRDVIIVDPMLATGNSAAHAADVLNQHGVADEQITFMALVTVPEGVRTLHRTHPGIRIFAAAMDRELNDHAYIIPGLGDAGDRLFGTA